MVDSMPSFETKCVQKIYKQSGGFSAWEGWKAKCRGKSLPSMDHCFKTGFDTVFEEYEEDGQFDSSEYTAENSVAVQKIIPPFWCSFFKPEKFPQTDEFARIWCE